MPVRHPLFLLTTNGNLTWSYIFLRHISRVLLGAYCMICVFACFILCIKSSILAGHTYLREPKLFHDLLELLSMLHLYLFEHGVISIFLKKCSLDSLRFIWELVKFWRNSLLLHLNYFDRKKILCSWSSLIFVWAYEKQHIKVSPKVIDIQKG